MGPSVSWIDTSYNGFLRPCISGGILNYVDALSVHPYREYTTQPPDIPETVANGDSYSYAAVRNLMQTYGHKTLPLAATEWGYSSSYPGMTDQIQGDYLARMFLVNMSQNIPLTTYYDWSNDGWDPTVPAENYGMVTAYANLVPKPAYWECQLLTSSLKGETFSKRLNDGNTNDWLLVFSGGGHTTLAAWTTGTADTPIVPGWGTLHLTSTPYYVNPTLLYGDINLDGTVDVQDLAILAANYRKHVTGGWLQGDFNNDGVVDVEDLALLAANYRHSYASDVVPDYAGFDAAAIQVLSQAGLTMAPEPGTLAMLAVALIGALAYTWRK